jgi:cytochrome P450
MFTKILLLVAIAVFTRLTYVHFLHPLSSYPGPWICRFTRLWKVYSVYCGHTERDFIALHRKYGPIVRVAPNELSFNSPDAAHDILAPGNGFTKTEFYRVFPPKHAPDIFTEIREWKHAAMKRVAVIPYSLASVQKMSPWIEQVQQELIDKIAEKSKCDLGNLLHYFAFDVVGEFAFSQRYGFVREEKDVGGTIKFIDDIQWYDGIVGQIPEFRHVLRESIPFQYLISKLSPPQLTQMALGEVSKRKQTGGNYLQPDRRDLLGQLLEGSAKDPSKLSEMDVFSIAHGAIGAGADSTASTMQSFFWFVLSDKQVYDKLCNEIRGASLSKNVTWTEAQDLSYFQACLLETMRLRPAVGLSIPRYVPKEGARIAGKFFPGGMIASVNGWAVHRTSLYGDRVDEFQPDRWFSDSAKDMKKHMYQVSQDSRRHEHS